MRPRAFGAKFALPRARETRPWEASGDDTLIGCHVVDADVVYIGVQEAARRCTRDRGRECDTEGCLRCLVGHGSCACRPPLLCVLPGEEVDGWASMGHERGRRVA